MCQLFHQTCFDENSIKQSNNRVLLTKKAYYSRKSARQEGTEGPEGAILLLYYSDLLYCGLFIRFGFQT